MIINANMSASQINSLIRVLRLPRKAIGFTIDDLTGVHPSVCIHCILMEDENKPSIEHQRRLDPNLSLIHI